MMKAQYVGAYLNNFSGKKYPKLDDFLIKEQGEPFNEPLSDEDANKALINMLKQTAPFIGTVSDKIMKQNEINNNNA